MESGTTRGRKTLLMQPLEGLSEQQSERKLQGYPETLKPSGRAMPGEFWATWGAKGEFRKHQECSASEQGACPISGPHICSPVASVCALTPAHHPDSAG